MTVLDAPLRGVAKQLIAQFGAPVTLKTRTPGAYNAGSGVQQNVPAEVAVKVLISEEKRSEVGEGVGAREMVLLMAALDNPEPTTADQFLLGGRTLEVTGVKPVYSGEQVSLYEIRCRR